MIPVYQAEVQAGLREKITSSLSVAHARAELAEPFSLKRFERSIATNYDQPDLHYLKTVLVSTGWNLNDDVFDRAEVWAARRTPEDKPFNYEHDCADIIGHMTECYAADNGSPLADDLTVDQLPKKYDVVTQAVLYKLWKKEDLQRRMDALIAEIAQGKWFVSMEAYFRGFDYAFLSPKGEAKVVAREQATAHITKSLRAYGGTGQLDGWRVGRLLRNITFSGKGLVREPANPDSVILTTAVVFASSGYSPISEEKPMSVEVDTLKTELEQLKAALKAKTEAELALTAALTKAEAERARAEAGLAEAAKRVDEVVPQNEALKAALKDAQDRLAEAGAQVKAVTEERDALKKDKTKAERVRQAMAKFGSDEAKATKFVEPVLALPEEQFLAHLEAMAALVVTKEKEEVELPEKDKNAGKADLTVLDDAKANKEPALSATEARAGVNENVEKISALMMKMLGRDKK